MRAGGWRRLVLEGVVGVALPVALARVPPVVALLPSLGVLRGPAALVLAAVAASLCVCRVLDAWRPGWSAALARTPPWLLLVLTAGLYAGVGLYYASRLAVSGDEPHYLVMAQSLWRDHDLDLRDDYGDSSGASRRARCCSATRARRVPTAAPIRPTARACRR